MPDYPKLIPTNLPFPKQKILAQTNEQGFFIHPANRVKHFTFCF
jgi:hypothetical protein